MPLVRVDLSADYSKDTVSAISGVIYDAMITIANVPEHDKFQVINRHRDDELVYPADGYLGITYTPGIVFIQVTWNAGRSVETKKAFYKAIADRKSVV